MEIAKEHYGTVTRMATFWQGDIGSRANNQRSTQLTSFKKIWLTRGAPHALVINVTTPDVLKYHKPMKVTAAVVQSGLATVEDVRKCLKSKAMYLNPVIYDLLCSGIESGKLKHYPKAKKPSTLRRLITIAHEAHIRLELWFTLGEQKFAHDPSTSHGEKRIRMWKKMLKIVKADRERNAEEAEKTRSLGASSSDNVNVGDESDDDEAPGKPKLDPMYY
jgi:hypothetical protein